MLFLKTANEKDQLSAFYESVGGQGVPTDQQNLLPANPPKGVSILPSLHISLLLLLIELPSTFLNVLTLLWFVCCCVQAWSSNMMKLLDITMIRKQAIIITTSRATTLMEWVRSITLMTM